MTEIEYERYWSQFHPMSVCTCGHTGDGGNSSHTDGFEKGHGRCAVAGCACKQFTWAGWTVEAKAALNLK